jgi:hypothetical protein
MNTIERIEARQVFAPGGEPDVRKYITLDEWSAIKAVIEAAKDCQQVYGGSLAVQRHAQARLRAALSNLEN